MKFFSSSSPVVPSLVSALPSNPYNGQEIYLQSVSMDTAGVAWHFRYRLGATGSYKWEFIGGPPLLAGTSNDDTLAAGTTTYATLTTAVQLTIPAAGDYLITNSGRFYPWAIGQDMYAAADGCGITAADSDAAWSFASANVDTTANRTVRKTLTSSGTLTQKYRHSNSGATGNFAHRVLMALPVRIG